MPAAAQQRLFGAPLKIEGRKAGPRRAVRSAKAKRRSKLAEEIGDSGARMALVADDGFGDEHVASARPMTA